jgi:hypothetical protein
VKELALVYVAVAVFTRIGPVPAPGGTVATIREVVADVTVAATPLNVTWLSAAV